MMWLRRCSVVHLHHSWELLLLLLLPLRNCSEDKKAASRPVYQCVAMQCKAVMSNLGTLRIRYVVPDFLQLCV
jgi:hypothetical protein